MLALDVNLLTKKLQRQTLDEGQTTPNIKLINAEDGYKLSQSAQATLAGTGSKKVYAVSLSSKTGEQKSEQPWRDFVAPAAPAAPTGSTTKVMCCHKKPLPLCQSCDSSGHTQSPARPKKRHCRSMSIPQETEINVPPAKSSWQPQGSGLWKPVPVTNSNRNCHLVNFSREINFTRNFTRTPTDGGIAEFASLAPTLQRHCETGHITPEDVLTPPESPIPRPSSAVYSDGAISPLGPWLDFGYPQYFNKHDVFRNRSLSLEDRISSNSSCTGSVASVPGSVSSMPSSPLHRNRIPRCRSQPSFYNDRKRRRRRDCRPTLNFHKMTETAYGHPCRSDPLAAPGKEQRHGSKFHSELENVMSLMPIASSPRDGEMPPPRLVPTQKRSSPIHELECSNRDNGVSMTDDDGAYEVESGPVKLLGEEEDEMEVFQLQEELDLEQIENH